MQGNLKRKETGIDAKQVSLLYLSPSSLSLSEKSPWQLKKGYFGESLLYSGVGEMSIKQRCHLPQETWLTVPCPFLPELQNTPSKYLSTNYQRIALKVDQHLFGIPGQGQEIQEDKPEESAYNTEKLQVLGGSLRLRRVPHQFV